MYVFLGAFYEAKTKSKVEFAVLFTKKPKLRKEEELRGREVPPKYTTAEPPPVSLTAFLFWHSSSCVPRSSYVFLVDRNSALYTSCVFLLTLIPPRLPTLVLPLVLSGLDVLLYPHRRRLASL